VHCFVDDRECHKRWQFEILQGDADSHARSRIMPMCVVAARISSMRSAHSLALS
jgi:hypothetical protein